MRREVSLRLTEKELRMIRHALTIGAEDGSLILQTMTGDLDPEEEELFNRVSRKVDAAIAKATEP